MEPIHTLIPTVKVFGVFNWKMAQRQPFGNCSCSSLKLPCAVFYVSLCDLRYYCGIMKSLRDSNWICASHRPRHCLA